MNNEVERLGTFIGWNVPFIKKEALALYGFYFIRAPDTVKCHFCEVELTDWDEGDDVLIEHMRSSPTCQFLKNHRQQDNIPIDVNILDETLSVYKTGMFPYPSGTIKDPTVRILFDQFERDMDELLFRSTLYKKK